MACLTKSTVCDRAQTVEIAETSWGAHDRAGLELRLDVYFTPLLASHAFSSLRT